MHATQTQRPRKMAGADPDAIPLDEFDVSQAEIFRRQEHHALFRRLRAEDPVHYCPHSAFGPYWSITKYDDIMEVDKTHRVFSSASGFGIGDHPADFKVRNFLSSDEPVHTIQRKAVMPAVAPRRLADVEVLIRERTKDVLGSLPRNTEFNWVDLVSKELTSRMLATLFDFPYDERHLLPYWSDVAAGSPDQFGEAAAEMPAEERREVMHTYLARFRELWHQRASAEPRFDFISLLAHNQDTRNLADDDMALMGTLNLLIIGGNDTTRNSMSSSLYALNAFPAQYDKLKADPTLISGLVNETIRWQTPLAHMRRTALEDYELRGKTIRKGDKVVMWYVSGNRDEDMFDAPDEFRIDRENARNHISFGFGTHRCFGNRVAEMQLRILWEEILAKFDTIEVVGEPVRIAHPMVMGIAALPVRIPG